MYVKSFFHFIFKKYYSRVFGPSSERDVGNSLKSQTLRSSRRNILLSFINAPIFLERSFWIPNNTIWDHYWKINDLNSKRCFQRVPTRLWIQEISFFFQSKFKKFSFSTEGLIKNVSSDDRQMVYHVRNSFKFRNPWLRFPRRRTWLSY
jgi:hypothetical protein